MPNLFSSFFIFHLIGKIKKIKEENRFRVEKGYFFLRSASYVYVRRKFILHKKIFLETLVLKKWNYL